MMEMNMDQIKAIRSAYELADYIRLFFDNSIPAFADAQGTTRHHVHKWIDRGAMVVDGKIFTYRRDLEPAPPGQSPLERLLEGHQPTDYSNDPL